MVQPGPSLQLALRSTVVAAVVALAACGTSSPPADDTAPLADLPLLPDSVGPITLGMEPDQVTDELIAVLGGPSSDTDWLPSGSGVYGECPLPLRVVSWGSLAMFFTGGADAGRLFAYSYGFDFDESLAGVDNRDLNLTTPEGIGLDSTVADLRALDIPVTLTGDETIDVWTFAIDESASPHLRGQVTGLGDDDTVLFLETSTGCS